MTLVAKGNHPNMSFISGWWITIYQPNGDDSAHCSSIGLQFFLRNNHVFGVNDHIWLMVHTPWVIWEWLKMNNPSKKLDSFRSKRDQACPKQCPKSKVAKTMCAMLPCLKLGWSAPCRAIVPRPGKPQAFEVVPCKSVYWVKFPVGLTGYCIHIQYIHEYIIDKSHVPSISSHGLTTWCFDRSETRPWIIGHRLAALALLGFWGTLGCRDG